MATKKQYSDEDKASALAALDANGGNASKTARQLGIPRITLLDWSKNRGVSDDMSELRQVKKVELAEKLEEIAHKLADAIPGKINDATLQQTATSLAIAVDKLQLLKGEPTERTEHQGGLDLTVTDAREQLARKLDSVSHRIGTQRGISLTQ